MKSKQSKTGKRSSRRLHGVVKHPDSIMLDWVAEYVTEISSLKVNKGEMMQLSASDEDDCVLITRRGKTDVEVFRKCVKAAMKQIPKP